MGGSAQTGRFVSIGMKLTVATVGVLSLVSLLLFLELSRREREMLITSKETAATMVADLFAASLEAPLDFRDVDAIDVELKKLGQNRDVTYVGVWLLGEPTPALELHPTKTPPTAPTAASRTLREDRVDVARRVTGRGGKIVGSALLSFSLAPEIAAYESSRSRIFWLSALLALGTAGLLSVIARNQIVAPLRALDQAATRLGRGERKERLDIGGNDEVGRLARSFDAMGSAIQDREARLAAATGRLQEVLDYMRQAILVFGEGGVVEAVHSREAQSLFGDVTGKRLRDLLHPDARPADVHARAFDEWLELAFSSDDLAWPDVAELAPTDATVVGPMGARDLELSFRLLPASDTQGKKIMLLATDVSERRRLEAVVRSKEQEHAQKMAAMRRLLTGGGQVFVRFLEGAGDRLRRCAAIFEGNAALSVADLDRVFQDVHTIKGEARSFDLGDLATAARDLEEALAAARSQRGDDVLRAKLAEGVERMQTELARGRALFVAASPIGAAALDQVTVNRSDVDRLLELASPRADEIGRLASRLASRPFGELMAPLTDGAAAWAEAEGRAVRLELIGRDVLVPQRLAAVLGGIVTHLVRNAIAHGVEPPEERAAQKKPPVSVLRLSCEDDGKTGPVITVTDDGRGLDTDALRESARKVGIATDDATGLALASGVSTADGGSDLAGRGMGLGAAKADTESAGYELSLTSEPGSGTTIVLRSPRRSGVEEGFG